MSRWFRHYVGMCRDPKFISVAASSGQPLERVIYVASWLMEDASDRDEAGACAGEAAQIAYMLRCDPADVAAVIEGLNAVGFIKDGVIVAWAKRQFESDSSTERSRRHRAKKRQENVPETSRNADATLQGRDATPPESETESDSSLRSEECPKPGKRVRTYPPEFETFWTGYPDKRNNSKTEAHDEWKKLSPEERALASTSLPHFTAFCRQNPDYPVIHACRYLKRRRFESHLRPPAANPAPRPQNGSSYGGCRGQDLADAMERAKANSLAKAAARAAGGAVQ